jgi:hypothetical protein
MELLPKPAFLDLPVEIRLEIYKYLLLIPPYNILQVVRPSTKLHVALLRTNRKIHDEATPILYSQNTFVAHRALLASFPSLRRWYPPVKEPSVISRIRRFHVRVRLDCDPNYDADSVTAAFSGKDELTVEVSRAMILGASYSALRRFEGVRGVRKVKIFGSITGIEGYVAWLEDSMRSDIGSEVAYFDPDAPLIGLKVAAAKA